MSSASLLAIAAVALSDPGPATLEDLYGDAGNTFQGAVGFINFQGEVGSHAVTSYGEAIDDMVVEWREFTLAPDATDCATGSCAVIKLATTNVFDSTEIGVTVLELSPDAANDCDLDGTPDGTIDCDGNGTHDIVVRATSEIETAGEIRFLNRCDGTGGAGPSCRGTSVDEYRGTITVSSLGDAPGVLWIGHVGVDAPTLTVTYLDKNDGTGKICQNDVDPAKQGVVRTATTIFLDNACSLHVVGAVFTDNGDHDDFVDSNETATMRLQLVNDCGFPLTHCMARISPTSPEVECVLDGLIDIPVVPNDPKLTLTTTDAFVWKAASFDQQTPGSPSRWGFSITVVCDEIESLLIPQSVSGEFDLDMAFDPADLTTWREDFEAATLSGTKFLAQNNDAGLPGNDDAQGLLNSDGWRCQYSDPDWPNSGSYGGEPASTCYPAMNLAQSNAIFWQLDGPDASIGSPDGGRAKTNAHSLHYGKFLGVPNRFTTPMSVVEAAATVQPINLGPGDPVLSYWHQISLLDHRAINGNPGRTADRGVVHYQLADADGSPHGDWIRLEPFQNAYDTQAEDSFFKCMFDPVDDGNTEDDFFDPTDPDRRLGPSSTCYPSLVYSCHGDTDGAFNTQSVCKATTPPSASDVPELGVGTWVQARVDLSGLRGRRIRLRYLVSSVKGALEDWQQQFNFSTNDPRDDGWWIDDIRVDQTLVNPASFIVDPKPNATLPACGSTCNQVLTRVLVTPPGTVNPGSTSISAPGRVLELNAASPGAPSTADRCLSGVLQFRFERDGQLLRSWTGNPIMLDAPVATPPATSVTYTVRVRCSTDPSCVDDEDVVVEVGCPSTGTLQRFPTIFAQADKVTFSWTPFSAGSPTSWWVFSGAIDQVAAYGGSLLFAGAGTSFDDATVPAPGEGSYYVLGRTDAELCNEKPALWTEGGPGEVSGRDAPDPGGFPDLP
jgi:hypothetical protein